MTRTDEQIAKEAARQVSSNEGCRCHKLIPQSRPCHVCKREAIILAAIKEAKESDRV